MKNLLMFTFLTMSGSFIATDYFATLPPEIHEQIISGVVQEGDLDAAIKNIQQLRLVNKDFRDLIDSEYFTRYLIDTLSQKEFPKLPETKTQNDKEIVTTLLLGTPTALNYVKQEDLNKFIEEIEYLDVEVFGKNIDFYNRFAKALLNAGVSINNSIFDSYAGRAFEVKNFDLLRLFINKGYDFSELYEYYFFFLPLRTENGCKNYKPFVEFMLKSGMQFNPKMLDRYKAFMSYVEKEDLPYCEQIYDLLVNAKENQNPNLPQS